MKNKKIFFTIIAIMLVLALGGFGCKQADEAVVETEGEMEVTQTTQEVTFEPPTPDTASTDTIEEETVEPTQEVTAVDTTIDEVDNETTIDTVEVVDQEDSGIKITNEAPEPTEDEDEASEEDTVLRTAQTLTEIYGTFTNKDDEAFGNLTQIKPYATDKVKEWLDGKIAKGATADLSDPFYGITTSSVSAGVLESSNTTYVVLVTTEREEITETSNTPKKFYQLAEVNMVKEEDDWKVDGIYWQ